MKQSIRSKQELTKALLQLMDEKNFSKITVKDIAEQALLDRRTFYRHYKSKEEIISRYCDDLCESYIKRLEKEPVIDMRKIVQLYFSFWYEHQPFVSCLVKNKLQLFILKMYDKYLPEIRTLYSGETFSFESMKIQKYALAFNLGGLFNALIVWVENDFRETPEEMEEVMMAAFKTMFVPHH
ncbi:TetR/AcrR family transcriptional regulator [Enterococcus rivorum]|uniref:HTH tetR-type domain-containing protein n=1 Tax=Enterococcus rivorum TaxID=762845 RepID=A0A1E5KYY8_9ENTE|nr:TetR/AcrR family transcriptional regulator [Enterococcus rivorum]MBP2097661.1 AcrR family transcriptional regulator [Enterococcus rivorum]OEH83101.1 hypothetical protein BCR26_02195 [Enterococcus rivorum]